jgi:hypothetical protein
MNSKNQYYLNGNNKNSNNSNILNGLNPRILSAHIRDNYRQGAMQNESKPVRL